MINVIFKFIDYFKFLNKKYLFAYFVIATSIPIFTILLTIKLFYVNNFEFIDLNFGQIFYCINILSSAIFEELFFRFFLLEWLLKKYGLILSNVIQALIFSLCHYMSGVLFLSHLGYFIGGLCYGIGYLILKQNQEINKNRMDLIIIPGGLHFGWNFCQSILLGMNIRGFRSNNSIYRLEFLKSETFNGGQVGFEDGLSQIFSRTIIFILVLFWYIKIKKENYK